MTRWIFNSRGEDTMEDATGKVGGKRALDINGNWIYIKSLPESVQKEISDNTKKADTARMKKALGNNKEYVDVQNSKKQEALEEENRSLKDLVKSQGEMLAAINAKLEMGATVIPVELPKVEPETINKPKKLTKKQKVMAEAESLGLEFEESDTIAEIELLISEAAINEFDEAQEA